MRKALKMPSNRAVYGRNAAKGGRLAAFWGGSPGLILRKDRPGLGAMIVPRQEAGMKIILWILGLALIAAPIATAAQALFVGRAIAAREARLTGGPGAAPREDLPATIRAFALRGMAGRAPGGHVRLRQSVEMVLKRGAGWQTMTARQVIGVETSGFVWVAAMTAGPVPIVRVVDTYSHGHGFLEIRALGAWRMGRMDGPQADVAEASRYLAELPWSPDAILLNRAVAWTETAEGVEAAIETAGGPARVTFHFDAQGDIVRMTARDRPASQPDGSTVTMDWEGRFSDYSEIGGRRIPRRGEVGYIYPEGYEPYWRGTITDYAVSS